MKDCLRIVNIIWLMLVSVESFSQGKYDTLACVTKYPVKKGYVCLFDPGVDRVICPGRVMSIFSKDSCVYAVMEGKLTKIFNVDEVESVMTGRGDTFVLYGNMDKVYRNVGDTIHKGDLIGTIKKDTTDDRFELLFQILPHKRSLFIADQIKILKRIH